MDAIEAGKDNLEDSKIEEFRKKLRKMVADGLEKFKPPKRCILNLGKIPEGKTRRLLLRLKNYEDAVFMFLDDFEVEFTNNESLCEGFGNAKVFQPCLAS